MAVPTMAGRASRSMATADTCPAKTTPTGQAEDGTIDTADVGASYIGTASEDTVAGTPVRRAAVVVVVFVSIVATPFGAVVSRRERATLHAG